MSVSERLTFSSVGKFHRLTDERYAENMDVHGSIQTRDSQSNFIRRFFYDEEVPYGLAVIRILLPLILLCVVIPRWSHSREFYSADGATAPLAIDYGYVDFLPVPAGTIAVAMMTVLAFCLVASSVGWHTRISLVVAWGLYTYLNMLDSLSTSTKYSAITSHVLLLLSLSNCGAIWSIDRWRSRRTKTRDADGVCEFSTQLFGRSAAWPRRLIQLLIGMVYFGAAFTKMHTDGFMSSDQLRYWLLTNVNNSNPLGELLALYPSLIIMMSHIAIVFQVLFVFIAWRGRARVVMLSLGILFHLSTVWLFGLFIFPPIMIATYFAWMNEGDVRRIQAAWPRLCVMFSSRRVDTAVARIRMLATQVSGRAASISIPSAALFSLGMLATAFAGVELEYRSDHYGRRSPDGPFVLEPLSAERVQELMSQRRIHQADKFFSLELGTETLGGVVVHCRDTFEPGESLIAQCTVVPPHEDMWVVCRLEDSAGRLLYDYGQPVTREMRRVNFTYQFPSDFASGDYRFVVRCNGEDVLSQAVHVGDCRGSLRDPMPRSRSDQQQLLE
jgi:hypothetical protein